jgi:hypothetical protein
VHSIHPAKRHNSLELTSSVSPLRTDLERRAPSQQVAHRVLCTYVVAQDVHAEVSRALVEAGAEANHARAVGSAAITQGHSATELAERRTACYSKCTEQRGAHCAVEQREAHTHVFQD